jgi:hypothetical protein
MRFNQNNVQKSISHKALVVLAAIALGMAVVPDAMAAKFGGTGFGGTGSGHGGAGFGDGHLSRGFRGPLPESFPSMPSPVFNPSEPYTLPESPEVPVSPASPGSIFGNG